MQSMFSRRKPLYRPKRYGLGPFGIKLILALWWGVLGLVLQQIDLPDTAWAVVMFFGVFFVPPIIAFFWDERRAARLRQHDLAIAIAAIRKPLRHVKQLDGRIVDFDPHHPETSVNGGLVSAIDPRRRLIRMIAPGMIDADGQPMDETGPPGGDILGVEEKVVAGKRRWLWLLPPRIEDRRVHLVVTSRGTDGKTLTLPLPFRADDPAAPGWRRTLEQWIREDQQRNSS